MGTDISLRHKKEPASSREETGLSLGVLYEVKIEKASLLEFRPVVLVGLDEVVENEFRDLGARDGLREREGLPKIVLGVLDPRVDREFLDVDLLLHHAFL